MPVYDYIMQEVQWKNIQIVTSTLPPQLEANSDISTLTDSEKEEVILIIQVMTLLAATICSEKPYLRKSDESLPEPPELSQEPVKELIEKPDRLATEKSKEAWFNRLPNRSKVGESSTWQRPG